MEDLAAPQVTMTQPVFPTGVFCLVLGVGVFVTALGALQCLRARRAHEIAQSRNRLAVGIIAVAVGLLILGGSVSWVVGWYAWRQDVESRRAFTFSVQLEFNGSAAVRVSIPIPVEERLLAGIGISPPSSTFVLNRSGTEPALDVTFSEPTTVHAEFLGRTPPDRFEAADLTRNDQIVSTLTLAILTGDVDSAHVDLLVSWERSCHTESWEQDVWIARGTGNYPGRWRVLVC